MHRHPIFVGFLLLASVALQATPVRARDDLRRVEGSERWTAVSGQGSQNDEGRLSSLTQALYYVRFGEQSDESVLIETFGRRVFGGQTPSETYAGPKLQIRAPHSTDAVVLDTGYITAIQVCLNGDSSPKIKGARIWGGTIDWDAHVTPISQSPKFEHSNCKRWDNKVSCGADKIVTGIRGYFSDRYDKGYSGVALQCSKFRSE